MNKDLAILPIHGMGKTKSDFADDIRDALKDRLGNATWRHVHWEPVYYQGLLQKAEDDVFKHMRQAAELDWMKLRKFMLFSFADASGLEHGASRPGSVYEKAQNLQNSKIEVEVPGGILHSHFGNKNPLLIGPAQFIGQVQFYEEALK